MRYNTPRRSHQDEEMLERLGHLARVELAQGETAGAAATWDAERVRQDPHAFQLGPEQVQTDPAEIARFVQDITGGDGIDTGGYR